MNWKRFLLVGMAAFLFFGCGGTNVSSGVTKMQTTADAADDEPRETNYTILEPEASGTLVAATTDARVDYSNTQEGYIMAQYTGSAQKAKIQISVPDGTVYTYTLLPGDMETLPLAGGDGAYHLDFYEHVQDNQYALLLSQDMDVTMRNEFLPFLYPNQYVWFTADSKTVAFGQELSGKSTDDLSYVENVYNYVTENITYDTEKAENIPTDYLPVQDETLDTGTGICFDYASLMSALLRSQNIPTKLEIGYSGDAYHAWISVWLDETGWVDDIIEFDGESWSLMDPTLGANNNAKKVKKYIGDGSNYTVKYTY